MRNRINKFRKKQGLTMKALADQIGTTASQINKLEKGERRLTADWMQKLAGALGCSPLELFADADQFGNSGENPAAHRSVPNLCDGESDKKSAWHIPDSLLEKNGHDDADLAIVTVLHRDLEPDVSVNDYVGIDRNDTLPSSPGVFVVEEAGELVLRHCSLQGRAPSQRIKVTAMQQSETGEPVRRSALLRLDQVQIKGRVIGHWHWV